MSPEATVLVVKGESEEAEKIARALDEHYRVKAKFVAYKPEKTIPIVNILDEVSDERSGGYVEFQLKGKTEPVARSQ